MSEETMELQYPDKLDALIAAPQHHQLLFENEFVRVLDTNIPAGEITNLHMHKYPASLYIISWSDFVRYDAEGNELVDSSTFAETPAPSSVLWSKPLQPHALENVGKNELHVICVEIKR